MDNYRDMYDFEYKRWEIVCQWLEFNLTEEQAAKLEKHLDEELYGPLGMLD